MTKKRFLLALALMLTAVGGAWAQGHQKYTSAVAMTSLQAGDTLAEGFSLTGQDGNFIRFDAGRFTSNGDITQISRGAIVSIGANCVITASGGAYTFTPKDESGNAGNAWLVTNVSSSPGSSFADIYLSGITVATAPAADLLIKDNDTLWHLTTPAGNVTLSVTYYGQYRLDSIPQGWTVMVNDANWNDSLKTYTDGGNTQMRYIAAINETDSVELIPPDSLKDVIKSVTLVEPAPQVQTLSVGSEYGNFPITYTPGETWRQAIQNHATENSGWEVWGTPNKVWKGEGKLESMTGEVWNLVDPDTAISSSTQYRLNYD